MSRLIWNPAGRSFTHYIAMIERKPPLPRNRPSAPQQLAAPPQRPSDERMEFRPDGSPQGRFVEAALDAFNIRMQQTRAERELVHAIHNGEAAQLLRGVRDERQRREKQDEIEHLGALLLREQAACETPDRLICRNMARSLLDGPHPIDAKLGVLCLLLAQDHAQALVAALKAYDTAMAGQGQAPLDVDHHLIHAIVAAAALGQPVDELARLEHQLYVLEAETLAAALMPLRPAALATIARNLEPLSALSLFAWMRATPWQAVLTTLRRLPPGQLVLAEECHQVRRCLETAVAAPQGLALREEASLHQVLARVLLRGMAVPAALHEVQKCRRLGCEADTLRNDPFLHKLQEYPDYDAILGG